MRALLYTVTVMIVMGLAFWAYRENYQTQATIDDMNRVQREIGGLREQLGVLRAEWAYLNRPERLRDLVDLNFERLKLVPVQAGQFGGVENVDYPPPPTPDLPPEGEPDAFSDPPVPADAPAIPGRPRSRPVQMEIQP